MKKTICLMLMGLGIAVAWGDAYLYWMIDVDQTAGALGDKWADGDTVVVKAFNGGSGEALMLSYGDGTSIGKSMTYGDVKNVADYSGVGVYAALATSAGDGWSYIVELYNSQSALIGQSDVISYSGAVNADYIANFSGGSLTPVSLWMPAVAVPEPNSALLFLFGCAVLGLRRKRAVR